MGIKSNLEYYFPDGQEEPHHPMCVPLPQGIEPLNEVEEQQVARYAYDQVNKSNNKNKYVRLYVYIFIVSKYAPHLIYISFFLLSLLKGYRGLYCKEMAPGLWSYFYRLCFRFQP
jgi:hypothetical protein